MSGRFLRIFFFVAVFVLAAACGQRSKITDFVKQQDIDAAEYFSDRVTEFSVKVYYEDAAAPYAGAPLGGSNTWDITFQSFTELFKAHTARRITVPRELSAMTPIGRKNVSVWDEKQLTELAKNLATAEEPGQKVALVIFIHGNYQSEDAVLGLHFSGLRAAFIFKDNLQKFGGSDQFLRRMEQATVVHEVGHVVGLVNNGVPMAVPHEDAAHPHHSTDSLDVMYWDIATVVSRTNETNLFGKNSLADGQAYHLR